MNMNIEATFTFRNPEATEPLRDHALGKLERLEKYLFKPAAAHCILKVEGARHVAEITLNANGGRYVGTETSTDMYTSIDGADWTTAISRSLMPVSTERQNARSASS